MMTKVAKFVLGCYILLMFKPVVPIIADIFAHTFNEQQHILLVHEVHGKFHIHQELANAGQQSEHEKSNEQKAGIEEYINETPLIFQIFLTSHLFGTYLTYIDYYPITHYRDAHYPPPQPVALNETSGAACRGSWFRASI
jgi:hypothetical protein